MINSGRWWEKHQDVNIKSQESVGIYSFVSLFLQDCIRNGKILQQFSVGGYFVKPKHAEDVLNTIKSMGYTQIIQGNDVYEEGETFRTFVSPNGIMQLNHAPATGNGTVIVFSSEESEVKTMREAAKVLADNQTKVDYIYIMVQTETGLRLQQLGMAAVPLVKTNYTSEVLDKFNDTIKELKSPNPNGRLVIMDGTFGTGKSYLVRSMIKAVPDALWVFIPSEMVAGLAGPSLLPVLLREKEDGKPFILVVEDADECLIKRDSGNFSAISTLLNATAGMLGDLIDIRVVCTTNTPVEDIDKAAVRDGRLLERIEVKPLEYEDAVKAYKGLTKKDPPEGLLNEYETYTLANIYSLVKKGKSEKTDKPKRKTGFI